MQKGFSLVELLIVSLLGSLLLLAASQGLATLAKHQKDQSELLRLTERSNLAEVALKKAINKTKKVLIAGEATQQYPSFSQQNILLGYPQNSKTTFEQFSSSDWMLLSYGQKNTNPQLLHLDKKTYGHGLALKDFTKSSPRSDTLVNQVELLRLRFFDEGTNQWVKASQITPSSNLKGVQFAFLTTSSLPLTKASSSEFNLWGETLTPPKDGLHRQLISATALTRGN